MNKVILAEHAGFCGGVRRAVLITEKALVTDDQVYVAGDLVHNKDVMRRLTEQGLRIWQGEPLTARDTIIIRAHGTELATLQKFEKMGARIIDATCPDVAKIHRIAEEAAQQKATLIVFGEADHPEVKGILSRCPNNSIATLDYSEITDYLQSEKKKFIVSQTTANKSKWHDFIANIQNIGRNYNIFNTICPATAIRQASSVDLACQADIIFVVGGYNSSNTRRLYELCSRTGVRAYHIENATDIITDWFKETDSVVGVTAGASTPDWVIKEVIVQMEKNLEKDVMVTDEATVETEAIEEATVEAEGSEEATVEAKVSEEATVEAEATEEVPTPDQTVVEEVTEEVPVTEEPAAESVIEEEAETTQPDNMEDMLSEDVATIQRGSIITGKVIKLTSDEALVDVGYKSEGIVKLRELTNDKSLTPADVVSVGDDIDVFVVRVSDDNGNPVLSLKRAQSRLSWNKVREAHEEKVVVTGKVIEAVKGGLLVDVFGMRAFLPASLVDRNYVADLNVFVGQDISAKIIEIDQRKRRVVLSRQLVLEESYQEKQAETWKELAAGQILEGKVQRLTKFGAFVDIGSVDGLVHISELSWGRVEHPSEVLSEGDTVTVKVLGVDTERQRVSLSIRQVTADPWTTVEENYKAGEVKQGKVVRTVGFGAFVELEPGIEGLVHISQLAWKHVEKAEDVVNPGDMIEVKILSVNQAEKRISLSIKETTERPARTERSGSSDRSPRRQSRTVEHKEASNITLGDMFGDLLNKAKNKNQATEPQEKQDEPE